MDVERMYNALFQQALAESPESRAAGLGGARARLRRRNRAKRVAAERTRAAVGASAWAAMRNRSRASARRNGSRRANELR